MSSQLTLDEKPLVTFALFAYNQEKYIQEALEGAFSQTYSPLQIILSDDCSTDRTFEIIEEMVSKYRGTHKIIVNKNENNLGISSHVNKIISLANGSLIVAAAGDDLSFPTRVSELTSFWIKHGKPSGIIYSRYQPIDHEGNLMNVKCHCEDITALNIQEFASCTSGFNPGIVGATQAWTKDLFIKFGSLPPGLYCEDAVFAFRAKLYGDILFLDRVLIKYRIHANSSSNNSDLPYKNLLLNHKRSLDVFRVFIADILNNLVSDRINDSTRKNLVYIIGNKIKQAELIIKMSEGTLKERILSAFEILKNREIDRILIVKNVICILMPTLHSKWVLLYK